MSSETPVDILLFMGDKIPLFFFLAVLGENWKCSTFSLLPVRSGVYKSILSMVPLGTHCASLCPPPQRTRFHGSCLFRTFTESYSTKNEGLLETLFFLREEQIGVTVFST